MIWIVGEYAERIDNADELLESFLEGFHDESTQVGLWGMQAEALADAVQRTRDDAETLVSRFSSRC